MNFYDAELKRDEDGVYSVLMGGIRVVPTVEKQERLYQASVPPQEIILGVRPEHIMLLENGEHGANGKVEVSEMMGAQSIFMWISMVGIALLLPRPRVWMEPSISFGKWYFHFCLFLVEM
ncbi:MAG: TOBE domain-containing protein [Faecalibacterium sp.]